jgi:hypothetical protein
LVSGVREAAGTPPGQPAGTPAFRVVLLGGSVLGFAAPFFHRPVTRVAFGVSKSVKGEEV